MQEHIGYKQYQIILIYFKTSVKERVLFMHNVLLLNRLKTKTVMPAFDYHVVKFGVFMQNKKFYSHTCRFVSPCFEALKNI